METKLTQAAAMIQWLRVTTWETRASMDREAWEGLAARAARMVIGTEEFVEL